LLFWKISLSKMINMDKRLKCDLQFKCNGYKTGFTGQILFGKSNGRKSARSLNYTRRTHLECNVYGGLLSTILERDIATGGVSVRLSVTASKLTTVGSCASHCQVVQGI